MLASAVVLVPSKSGAASAGASCRVITHYTILGISETATQAEIKAAFRTLLKKIHPDTVDTLSHELRREAEVVTRRIVEAYSVLSDPKRRSEYDRELAQRKQQSVRASGSPAVRTANPPYQRVRRRKWVLKVRRHWINDPVNAGILLVLLAFLAYYIIDLSLELADLLN